MSEKPNVTVIYQDAKQAPIGIGAIIIEVLALVVFVFVVGGGCMIRWWL